MPGHPNCSAVPVTAEEIGRCCDLVVSLGGDGTMLRAVRLADRQRAPVLGVNLGKLGFLAEVDVPNLPGALAAIDSKQFILESRRAIDGALGARAITAFNDVAAFRVPGQGSAMVAVHVDGQPFVSYACDAVVVATPTDSTACGFSAGGPIVSPAVEALLVTPAAPHSAYNRGVVISAQDTVTLEILASSGRLAVKVDGVVAGYAGPVSGSACGPVRPQHRWSGWAARRSTSEPAASCASPTPRKSPPGGSIAPGHATSRRPGPERRPVCRRDSPTPRGAVTETEAAQCSLPDSRVQMRVRCSRPRGESGDPGGLVYGRQ
jgi:NAD kinase